MSEMDEKGLEKNRKDAASPSEPGDRFPKAQCKASCGDGEPAGEGASRTEGAASQDGRGDASRTQGAAPLENQDTEAPLGQRAAASKDGASSQGQGAALKDGAEAVSQGQEAAPGDGAGEASGAQGAASPQGQDADTSEDQEEADSEDQDAPSEDQDTSSPTDSEGAGKGGKKGFFKKKKDKKDEQIEELTDRLKRQMAEFENFRKRTEKEKSQMYDMGAKTVIEKILPVVDNFERGLAGVPEEDKEDAFVSGMDKVYRQLLAGLDAMGVKPIEVVGKEFDPEYHNAVMQVESEEYASGTVAQELQKGYMYKDSVVRHSMVAVAQ